MPLARKYKTLIHVAKNQLGLDDDTYRDALEAHAGVGSSKDLDYQGFKKVMAHFERCGFVSSKADGRRLKAEGTHRPGMATEKMIKKIYALWWTLGGSFYKKGKERKALRAFLKKRFRVDHENFLDFDTGHMVIEAIKAIGKRYCCDIE